MKKQLKQKPARFDKDAVEANKFADQIRRLAEKQHVSDLVLRRACNYVSNYVKRVRDASKAKADAEQLAELKKKIALMKKK